jgi:uncharacterized BrkB/YihY/UPF0761 family membrane protein
MNPAMNAPVGKSEHWTSGLKRSELAALVLAVLTILVLFVVAVIPGWVRAQPSFYATAAQVIPVLILALVVDQVWRPGPRSRPILLAVVAMLVVGEFAAMLGTAYDVHKQGQTEYLINSSRLSSDLLEFLTVVGLGVGLTVVLWNTVFPQNVHAGSDD